MRKTPSKLTSLTEAIQKRQLDKAHQILTSLPLSSFDSHGANKFLTECAKSKENYHFAKSLHFHLILHNYGHLVTRNRYLLCPFLRIYGGGEGPKELESAQSLWKEATPSAKSNPFVATAMMNALNSHAKYEEIFLLFDETLRKGGKVDAVMFTLAFNACAKCKALEKGRKYRKILEKRMDFKEFTKDKILLGALLHFYGECGELKESKKMWELLKLYHSPCDVISYGGMIKAYISNEYYKEALEVYDEMCENGIKANDVIFILALCACAKTKNFKKGQRIHLEIDINHASNNLLNSLLHFYGECGDLKEARNLWNARKEEKGIKTSTYNSMISAYLSNGKYEDGLSLFDEMGELGVKRDFVTFIIALNLCANNNYSPFFYGKGKEIHKLLSKNALLGAENNSSSLLGALIHFYGEHGHAEEATKVWNSQTGDKRKWDLAICGGMMKALISSEKYEDSLAFYDKMKSNCPRLDAIVFTLALNACGKLKAFDKGSEVIATMEKQRVRKDATLLGALLHFYGECGKLESAKETWNILKECKGCDVTSYGAMMKALISSDEYLEALGFYDKMRENGIETNAATLTLALTGCSKEAIYSKGSFIIADLFQSDRKNDYLKNSKLVTSLVHFLGNCGEIEAMKQLEMDETEVLTALIGGYAKNGFSEKALEIYEGMEARKVRKDEMTYLNALVSCCHVGDAKKALDILKKADPSKIGVNHFNCVVDNLVRNKQFEEALEFIQTKVGSVADLVTWMTLYDACVTHENHNIANIARKAIEKLKSKR